MIRINIKSGLEFGEWSWGVEAVGSWGRRWVCGWVWRSGGGPWLGEIIGCTLGNERGGWTKCGEWVRVCVGSNVTSMADLDRRSLEAIDPMMGAWEEGWVESVGNV